MCVILLINLEFRMRCFLEHCDSNHVLIGFNEASLRVKVLVLRNVLGETGRKVN